MAVFDTWIHNGDRHNPGNLLVAEDVTQVPPVLRVAYIDYSNALTFHWPDAAGASNIVPIGVYPPNAPVDVGAIRDAIERIEALRENAIQGTASRVPLSFLPEPTRNILFEGLISRKALLRTVLGRRHPDLR